MFKHTMLLSTGGMGGNPAPPPPPPNVQAQPAGGGQPSTVVAPWASAGEGMWTIGDKPWYEYIPEEPVRELYRQKGYKNPAVGAVAYHSLNKLTSDDGRNFIQRPPPNATPEQKREFYTKLGALAKQEDYKGTIKFAAGVQTDPAMVSFGEKVAYELGLDPDRAQRLGDLWQEYATGAITANAEQQRAANDTALGELKTRWGANFDTYAAAGNKALDALFPVDAKTGQRDPAFEKLEAAIGSAPLVELMARLGQMAAEGRFVGGGNMRSDPNDVNNMTPAQAQEAANKLQDRNTSEGKAYWDKNDPQHATVLARAEQLHKRASQPA